MADVSATKIANKTPNRAMPGTEVGLLYTQNIEVLYAFMHHYNTVIYS